MSSEHRRGPGRPTNAELGLLKLDAPVRFDVSRQVLEKYDVAAAAAGLTRSAWIRVILGRELIRLWHEDQK